MVPPWTSLRSPLAGDIDEQDLPLHSKNWFDDHDVECSYSVMVALSAHC